jgi:hypothetical protein
MRTPDIAQTPFDYKSYLIEIKRFLLHVVQQFAWGARLDRWPGPAQGASVFACG